MVEAYLEVLELTYFEVQEAFKGLADAHVWQRPADGLLSVGELAGHIAYWEAVRLAGDGRQNTPLDQQTSMVSSPLIDGRFCYYPMTLAHLPSEAQRAMTAEQVCRELLRVHEEGVAHFKALSPDLDSAAPGSPQFTYREYLKYASFHVAYHTGQIYTARHLLGEETPDN